VGLLSFSGRARAAAAVIGWSELRGRAGPGLTGLLRASRLRLDAGLAARLELDDLRRALVLGPLRLDCPDEVQVAVHLVSSP
jgi:hypothetical protein